jgi:hypothetical protein
MLPHSHPKDPRNAKRTPQASSTPTDPWTLIEAIVDHFLILSEHERAPFLARLGESYPGTVLNKIAEAVARRVADGTSTPDVLAVFEYRALLAAFIAFHRARWSSQQVRILNAVIRTVPSLDRYARQALILELVCWGRAAVGRAATRALAVAAAAVRVSLGLDEKHVNDF